MNASVLLLRQGCLLATSFLCLHYDCYNFNINDPYVLKNQKRFCCYINTGRWQNTAGICARLPGSIPSLALAVRRPAPPLHDPAGADRGHGLHRRVRRLVQNRFLTYVSLIRNTVGLLQQIRESSKIHLFWLSSCTYQPNTVRDHTTLSMGPLFRTTLN